MNTLTIPDHIGRNPRAEAFEVMEEISSLTGVSVDEMRGRDRTRFVAHVRHWAMTEVRHRTSLSFPEIGALFDRDHTTVVQGVRAHEKRTSINPQEGL